MKNFETVLFDLDGTITDPAEGITNSVAYALDSYGIKVPDKRTLYPFIGPPLYASFMKYFGFSKEQSLEAVNRYREYYSVKGVFECTLYPGMQELLKNLNHAGKKVILATSKPEIFANQILKHFGIAQFFHLVSGATLDSHRVEKADIIKYAATLTNIYPGVMVGDREFDIFGAKATNLYAVGVTYGYGSRQELEAAGANIVCENVKDIEKLLL
ncbi:MAG: HAD family hydrolase [Clostridia bacterium]|nr:HAD family hydrolase [Clostridia bacterium]